MITLDLSLLRTFHAIARLGRFKEAAEHLNKSTSAVSVQVRRLEDLVGGRLFERNNMRVELSPRGRLLLAETARLLDEHDQIVAALTQETVAGEVHLGVPEEYAAGILEEFLPLFALENPRIELSVEVAPSAELDELYGRDKLDAAITVQRQPLDNCLELAMVRPVWAAGADIGVLKQSPLPVALHASGCPYRDFVVQTLKQSGREWSAVVSSGNSAVIASAIERGIAVGLVAPVSLSPSMRLIPPSFGLPEPAEFQVTLRCRHAYPHFRQLADAVALYFRKAVRPSR